MPVCRGFRLSRTPTTFLPEDYRSLPRTTAHSQARAFIPSAGVVGTGGEIDGDGLPSTEVQAKSQQATLCCQRCSRRSAAADHRLRNRRQIPATGRLSNERMQLTKLRAAPVLPAEVPPCAPAGRTDGGTASQLIRSVRPT